MCPTKKSVNLSCKSSKTYAQNPATNGHIKFFQCKFFLDVYSTFTLKDILDFSTLGLQIDEKNKSLYDNSLYQGNILGAAIQHRDCRMNMANQIACSFCSCQERELSFYCIPLQVPYQRPSIFSSNTVKSIFFLPRQNEWLSWLEILCLLWSA